MGTDMGNPLAIRQVDGRVEGWTVRQTDGQTDGWTLFIATKNDFFFQNIIIGRKVVSRTIFKGNVSLFEAGILCFNHRKSKVDDTNSRVTFSTSEISIKSLGRSAYRGHLT